MRIGGEVVELSWGVWEDWVRAGRIPHDALIQFDAVTGSEWARAEDLEMYTSLRNDAAIEWQHQFRWGPPPVLTALLVGVQIRIWWSTWIPGVEEALVDRFTNWAPPVLEDGEVWRLLSMGFLHVTTDHLFLNMMWLAYTGWNIERALGRANLGALYLASVLGGSVLSTLMSPETPSLGASGGVFGLVAASVVFGLVRPELLPARGRRVFGLAMLPYLVLMFSSGLMNARTDNWAHFGGLAVGAILALLLDPEPLQRRERWNLKVHLVLGALSLTLLLGLFLGGPRLERIVDSDVLRSRLAELRGARAPEVALEGYRPLTYAVPAGWKPGIDAARGTAHVSPVADGALRAWGVRPRNREMIQTTEAIAEAWIASLRREWPHAEISEPSSDEVAGWPGLKIIATIDAGAEPRRLEWRGVARGAWTLEEVWQVDLAREARLRPLRDRLRRSVVWGEPTELLEARRDAERLPGSVRFRSRLALALVRTGQVDEALALHEALIAEDPSDPQRWLDALEVVQTGLPQIEDPGSWWRRALEASSGPRLIDAVARGLAADDQLEVARGLLQLAWRASPGERTLKRALRRLDLPTELDPETGVPWLLVHDPLTGAPREAPQPQPLTLEAAAIAGAQLAQQRRTVTAAAVAAVIAGDRAGLVPVLVLRMGRAPTGDPDVLEALATELEAAIDDRVPAWMPPELVEALVEHPEYVGIVRSSEP
ncbi:MAG TPA: rhomboid family intramembrane serine protease [Deltaproteobacteria bacterium]|nr:rhomboid family intramembrane serine protease [Deltaproteobacteria bacterium]